MVCAAQRANLVFDLAVDRIVACLQGLQDSLGPALLLHAIAGGQALQGDSCRVNLVQDLHSW